jgi:hypothetical protein
MEQKRNIYRTMEEWPLETLRRQVYIKIGLREIIWEGGRWMEVAQNRIQWRDFVLSVLNLRVILPKTKLVSCLIT